MNSIFRQRVKASLRIALGWHRPTRMYTVFKDDVVIASYPKCGNTWSTFLIANLLHPDERVDFASIHRLVPSLNYKERDYRLRRLPRPRVLRTHHTYQPDCRRVIQIVRDPRDVAVSFYHFALRRGQIADSMTLDEYVPKFLSPQGKAYANWGENVGSWMGARYETEDFLLVRYEDMLEDAERELTRMAELMELTPEPERIATAVYRSSADEMRKLEKTHPEDQQDRSGQNIAFVRSARKGGWQESLSPQSARLIEGTWPQLMRKLGYLD